MQKTWRPANFQIGTKHINCFHFDRADSEIGVNKVVYHLYVLVSDILGDGGRVGRF